MPKTHTTETTCPYCGVTIRNGSYVEDGQECKTDDEAETCALNPNKKDE